jgi:hypothetical protein
MARRVFSSSDKCDFVLRGEIGHRPGEELAERVEFEAGLRRFRVDAGSDKCDWRVRTVPLSREAKPGLSTEVAFEKGEWSVQTDIPRGRVIVASDKCDWRMRVEDLVRPADAASLAKGLSVPPQVEAVTSSSKSDVSIQLRFGTPGGRGFRVEAIRAASDKCDFRLKQIEVSDDWTTWKAYTDPSSENVP